jgi:hypothetical protein
MWVSLNDKLLKTLIMSVIDDIFSYLKNEGLVPERTSFGIGFKYQMLSYVIIEDENDQNFVQIALPKLLDVDENNMLDALMACNKVNDNKKVIKALVSEEGKSVWILYETVIDSTPVYDDILPRAVKYLSAGRDFFFEALKE